MFDTTTITNLHVVSATKEIVRVENILISFNGNNDSFTTRAAYSPPWSDGIWYEDFGDISTGGNRASSPANAVATGVRGVFSAYKSSSALKNGFRLNGGTRYLSSSSTSATVSGGLRIGSMSTWTCNHNVYGLIVCNAQLGTSDELLLERKI
jgi:hypothetical protein